jgi:hypothetical protein
MGAPLGASEGSCNKMYQLLVFPKSRSHEVTESRSHGVTKSWSHEISSGGFKRATQSQNHQERVSCHKNSTKSYKLKRGLYHKNGARQRKLSKGLENYSPKAQSPFARGNGDLSSHGMVRNPTGEQCSHAFGGLHACCEEHFLQCEEASHQEGSQVDRRQRSEGETKGVWGERAKGNCNNLPLFGIHEATKSRSHGGIGQRYLILFSHCRPRAQSIACTKPYAGHLHATTPSEA